jgi:N-methylhydantoinase B
VKCRANINLERLTDPPWGLHGGLNGAINEAIITRTNGEQRTVRKETEIALEPGDRVTFLTAGGGGYGDPRERGENHVRRDLAEGFVTKAGLPAYGLSA